MIDIDTTFDFRNDTPHGKDPDQCSATLRRYHRRLWSKPLPSGAAFELDDVTKDSYLHHRSALGEFFLSSDSVINTYIKPGWHLEEVRAQIPEADLEMFECIGYTIGGMMLFPYGRAGTQTINQARGTKKTQLADRLDLTLECIRRHYLRQYNPLHKILEHYWCFFELFGDFRGYVEFFLLQDLITRDCSTVRFFLPFEDFTTPAFSAVPRSVEEYTEYRLRSIEFVEARNRRIAAWAQSRVTFFREAMRYGEALKAPSR